MADVRFTELLRRRAWLVGLLAVLAALVTWLALSGQPKTYERQYSFVVQPSDEVRPAELPEVLGTLSSRDSGVVQTAVGLFGSPDPLADAARQAGVSPDAVGTLDAPIAVEPSVRPGSAIIDVTLQGEDRGQLAAVGTSLGQVVARRLADTFGVYRLKTLGLKAPADPVAPRVRTMVLLALLLGGVLGVGAVAVEATLRSRRPDSAEPEATVEEYTEVDDLTGRTDQGEATSSKQPTDRRGRGGLAAQIAELERLQDELADLARRAGRQRSEDCGPDGYSHILEDRGR